MYLYIHLTFLNMLFTAKITFFVELRLFNIKYLVDWLIVYNFALRNTDEVLETTETNKTEVFSFAL